MFLFVPPDRRDGEAINLRYSIDEGQLGLDWVLLSRANVADQSKVEEFVNGRGHAVQERQENRVRFLRIEDGDLAVLGVQIARDLYRLDPSTPLNTIVEGFEWTPAPSTYPKGS